MDNPLSIVPSEGSTTDFPVLKAFQEYIDAEQAKARKRMLGLSVFFIVLLVTVVVTFVMILTTVLNRNQSLSDRLLDYALDERQRVSVQQPLPSVQQPAQTQPSADVMKLFMERMEQEQAEMKAAFERERKASAAKAAEAERQRVQELTRLQEELAKERAKAEAEAKKKADIEAHRRRLYPDYYRIQDEQLPIPPPAATYRRPQPQPAMPAHASTPAPEPAKKDPPPLPKKAEAPLSTLKPVTYFNVDDEDDVPFLLETPQQNK